jgi:hypothetical protein
MVLSLRAKLDVALAALRSIASNPEDFPEDALDGDGRVAGVRARREGEGRPGRDV